MGRGQRRLLWVVSALSLLWALVLLGQGATWTAYSLPQGARFAFAVALGLLAFLTAYKGLGRSIWPKGSTPRGTSRGLNPGAPVRAEGSRR